MKFSEFEVKRLKKLMDTWIEKNAPPHIARDNLDLSYRVNDSSVEIFELIGVIDKPGLYIEGPLALIKFDHGFWELYWNEIDALWHSYKPHPRTYRIEDALKVIEIDENSTFFGPVMRSKKSSDQLGLNIKSEDSSDIYDC